MKFIPIVLLLAAAPAFAHDQPTLDHEHELSVTDIAPPEPTPSPAPTATPVPPLCSESGPLVRCLAVQDPATALNARVNNVEQQLAQLRQQAAAAFQELNGKVDAIAPKKDVKK
jgi:hypothetical protein